MTLGDLPRMMSHHDRSHALEMANLLAEIAPGHPCLGELRAFGSAWPGTAGGP